jgi:hypothetical protein
VVYIELKNKKGIVLETMIDLEDFERVKNEDLSWHLKWAATNNSFYAKATKTIGKDENRKRKQATVHLHQFIMGGNIKYIDHENFNTLDNRKLNLSEVSNAKNLKHRLDANKNNKTTGIRNVSFDKSTGEYIVHLQVNGKNKALGRFFDLNEASLFAKEKRKEIYKEA